MSENSGSIPAGSNTFKGKGKDTTQDVSMDLDEDDSSSDEETGAEEEVCNQTIGTFPGAYTNDCYRRTEDYVSQEAETPLRYIVWGID